MPRIAKLAACLFLSCGLLYAGDARKIVERVEPEYPAIARKMQIRGVVKLKLKVAANGTVTQVEYVGGHPLLAESAVAAVRKWKFETGPANSTEQIEVKFSPE